MKLTIKKKNRQFPGSQCTSQESRIQKLSPQCCQSNDEGQRHIFVRPQLKQQQYLHDLIKLDCMYTYSKVTTNIKPIEVHSTISKTLSLFNVKYHPWIGYLCTHCCQHLPQFTQRMKFIGQFVQKFRSAYESQKCSISILSQTIKRVQKYCKQNSLGISDKAFRESCRKFQQTLLLEFIPVQYSEFMLERYLSNEGDIEQYVRLTTSLTHFILNTLNPINQKHFVDLMSRPYMGTVQWPVIIANRHMFEAEPVNVPLVQQF